MISFPIVGAHYRPPAKGILAALPVGTTLWLRAEPDNHVDKNAIAVWLKTKELPQDSTDFNDAIHANCIGFGFNGLDITSTPEWHLGYIPAIMAAKLAGAFPINTDIKGSFAVNTSGAPRIEVEE